jgi:hypothetical protein
MFVGERTSETGTERVVLGFELRPELQAAIQAAAKIERARTVKPTPGVLDSTGISAARSEEEIRQDLVDELSGRARNPVAPYTKRSRAVMASTLFGLWELMFGAMGVFLVLLVKMPARPQTAPRSSDRVTTRRFKINTRT